MPTLPKKLLPAACAQFRATYLSDNACHHQPAQRGGRHSSAHASYFVPLLPFRSRGRIFMNDLVRKVEKREKVSFINENTPRAPRKSTRFLSKMCVCSVLLSTKLQPPGGTTVTAPSGLRTPAGLWAW